MRDQVLKIMLCSVIVLAMCGSCGHGSHSVLLKRSDIHTILSPNEVALKYQTTIDLFKNHFSGILVAKQIDSTHAHLLFVSEIGMKIFDFEMTNDSLHLVSAFPGLESKPKAIALLKSDLGLIFLNGIYNKPASWKLDSASSFATTWIVFRQKDGKRTNTYITNSETKRIQRIVQKKGIRKKIQVGYDQKVGPWPQSIVLRHKGLIHLTMSMKKLD
jgi:hypothetical protein